MLDFSEPDREEGVVRWRCPKESQRKGPRGTTGEAEQLRVGQVVDDARQLAGSWVVGLRSRLGHLGPGRRMGRRGQSPEAGRQRQRSVVMGRAVRCGSRGAAAGQVLIRAEGATADSGKGHGVGEVILQPEGDVSRWTLSPWSLCGLQAREISQRASPRTSDGAPLQLIGSPTKSLVCRACPGAPRGSPSRSSYP